VLGIGLWRVSDGLLVDAIRLGRMGIRRLSWGCPTSGPDDGLTQNLGEGQGGEGAPGDTSGTGTAGRDTPTPETDSASQTSHEMP
jgi:hypothetical protein